MNVSPEHSDSSNDIAVVGMSLRVPGSADLETFWARLAEGTDSVTRFTDEELREAGIPDSDLRSPGYVKAKPVLEDVAEFDAPFFGMTPREAQVTDPQHRLFLESAYTALEHAGYDPFRVPGAVGVYGGGAPNFYREWNVNAHPQAAAVLGEVGVIVANATDYITTSVSHQLGLTGPSVNVVTACSTSLVAVHMACQALRAGECDAAVAGGVQVELPRATGYHAAEGGMFSVSGQIRPFDAAADGTIFGTGVGAVVLKPLDAAVADGDHVHAVIRASAINNDGAQKAGFTAPSIPGQAALIRRAMTTFGIDPADIGYVEAHGTGTRVGDPIEVNALTEAYTGLGLHDTGRIPIGSVKGNLGHLGPAAGVIGLIKTVLALGAGRIPPSINYREPNPAIDFRTSPFFVNTELSDWPDRPGQRRTAAVSSFGVGGTNAHVVVSEAPSPVNGADSRKRQRPLLLPVSARTEDALAEYGSRLADHLESHPGADLGAVARTLALGRPAFPVRAAVRTAAPEPPIEQLRALQPVASSGVERVAFLFPGQGSQYAGMGQELHAHEPVFRAAIDRCAEIAEPVLGLDLREAMFATGDGAGERLKRTGLAQPALFTIEYAMAQQLMSWGVSPTAMVGHSVGEYVAACLSGVFALEDAVRLVARRGALVEALPTGSMLAVTAAADDLEGLPGVEVAAFNGTSLTVLSGTDDAVDAAVEELARRGLQSQRLHTSHAFHSVMMEPAMADFAKEFDGIALGAPQTPFVSNVSGAWITDAEATDPDYWIGHLRAPVRFAQSVGLLLEDERLGLVEAGPGQVLTQLTRAHVAGSGDGPRAVVSTMPGPRSSDAEPTRLVDAVGEMWTAGITVDWDAFLATGSRRVPLPTYPFERAEHWLDAGAVPEPASPEVLPAERRPIERALFEPEWREATDGAAESRGDLRARWLVLRDGTYLDDVVDRVRRDGGEVVTVEPATEFRRLTAQRYQLRPGSREDYDRLVESLVREERGPERILHGWLAGPSATPTTQDGLDRGFFSVLFLAQALGERAAALSPSIRWDVVTTRTRVVSGDEPVEPVRAAVTGVCDVMAKEVPGARIRCIDLTESGYVDGLIDELRRPPHQRWVARRGRKRWTLDYREVPEPRAADPAGLLRERGTYLITGGLGGLGLTVAESLAKTLRARLVLTARSAVPPRAEWDDLLERPETSSRTREVIQALRRIEEHGAQTYVVQADVADEHAMRDGLAAAQEELGEIHGVFHAAGVAGGGLLALKSREEAERVLSAKVHGTLVLDRLLGDQVEVVVLFSSITSVAGNLGQTDYASGNAFLDAYAHARATEGKGYAVSVNWDAWAERGMAAEADKLAPAAFRALQAGGTVAGSLANDTAPAPSPESNADTAPEESVHPLLGERRESSDGEVVFEQTVDPDSHWVTREHQVAGTAVWPATAYVEMARAAAAEELPSGGTVQLADVTFLTALIVTGPTALRTTLVPERDGLRVTICSSSDGAEWTEHATCTARSVAQEAPQVHDLELLREVFPVVKPDTESYEPERGLIEFGPRWTNMAEIRRDDSSTVARIEMPSEYAAEIDTYALHPAMFDAATSNAVYLPDLGPTGESYLPFSVSSITVREALPSTVHVYSRRRGAKRNLITFDLTLTDDDGREVVDVTGYTVRVWDPADFRASVTEQAATPAPSAPSEGAVEPPAGEGLGGEFAIRPEEGMAALWHIVGDRLGPQVVVVPEGIDARLRAVESLTQDVIQGDAGEPEADSAAPAAAPSTDRDDSPEAQLTQMWADALGLPTVGPDDDFFELGGNSLVGVQLAARIRRELDTDLPIATLVENPTVRAIAGIIAT